MTLLHFSIIALYIYIERERERERERHIYIDRYIDTMQN